MVKRQNKPYVGKQQLRVHGLNQTHKSMGTNLLLKTDSIMGRKTGKLLRESRMPSDRK